MTAVVKKAHVWPADPLQWYVEPRRATEQLLSVETFNGRVLDPCCGGGNIVSVLRFAGVEAYGSDIVDRGLDRKAWIGVVDFDGLRVIPSVANIVMNPPFFRALGTERFIRRALTIAQRKVATFVDVRFLASQSRGAGLFSEHPPSRVWILSERPSCPLGAWLAAGNRASGGTADWCWMVWSKTEPFDGTRLGWLRGEK